MDYVWEKLGSFNEINLIHYVRFLFAGMCLNSDNQLNASIKQHNYNTVYSQAVLLILS